MIDRLSALYGAHAVTALTKVGLPPRDRQCLVALLRPTPRNGTVLRIEGATANLAKLLAVQVSDGNVDVVQAHYPHTLPALLRGNGDFLRSALLPAESAEESDAGRGSFGNVPSSGSSDAAMADTRIRFIVFQLLHALHHMHASGVAQGNLTPRTVFLNSCAWVRLAAVGLGPVGIPPAVDHAKSLTQRWCDGDVSNFEYLMALNTAAGRFMHDSVNHPVIPWVTDFTVANAGWRRLDRSKFRLNKGDRQLHMTYESSPVPHHLPENLSEITFCVYMARQLPMHVLRREVRWEFRAAEYPSTYVAAGCVATRCSTGLCGHVTTMCCCRMARLFEWTPDEAIAEFFTDPSVFMSRHQELPDMGA